MKKRASLFTAMALMSTSLVACNTNDDAMDTRYNNNMQPIGYYTNDNGDMIDNDGPITEMFDGGVDDNDNIRDMNDRNGRVSPLTVRDRNNMRNNGFRRDDYNYHNQLGNNNVDANEELAERISEQVAKLRNVEDVNTLVTNNNVIVAVDTNDRNNRDVQNRVRNVVQKMARGKNVNIVTDEATFTRIRNINRGLDNGNDVTNDIRELLNDIGETITEPFDNNNR
ncbi:YhcN/YlaJ family sporulation lipoprotein [Aeribacillus alveayuensis]|uniref:Spore cortex protein n=1 Tax=Aeribacillus alveayuensis TaxID=279215 RepID=A0ABT9VK34_9BACI|nr:spore cortex protein [Bacillus alveayuensis]